MKPEILKFACIILNIVIVSTIFIIWDSLLLVGLYLLGTLLGTFFGASVQEILSKKRGKK